jgi:predicted ATPase
VVQLLERASARQPLVIGVEDVHWADEATLEAVAALAELTVRAPIVLLVTSRIDGDPLGESFWSGIQRGSRTRLDLTPLDREAAEALAGGFAGMDSRRLRACVERAGGNPLFLEQLLLSEAEGVLPDSVQSLVQARMDRLEPRDKRALQAAAVVGQRFSLELLRHLLGDTAYDCTTLQQRGLVRREGEDWLFSHALVRDGAYSSLLRQARRDLHRQAATPSISTVPTTRRRRAPIWKLRARRFRPSTMTRLCACFDEARLLRAWRRTVMHSPLEKVSSCSTVPTRPRP